MAARGLFLLAKFIAGKKSPTRAHKHERSIMNFNFPRAKENFQKILLVLLCLVSCAVCPSSHAANNTITGLSEKLDVDPTTGTAITTIPINVPQGRAGIQPNIQLLYNSSSPNGMLGMGWLLDLGSIQRSTKRGAAKYSSSDTFVFTQSGSQ